ncbi:hypothetical protein Cgig2_011950 [Carnegiea gigantea]|uniref:Endoglucanase n=1 Tax=Carnegiea gigantea TaxID=171969 RepID=A0A9Q1GJQ3_9CARY|nr:hypothetical protein Cgig2_011950 [Carnegiea gigantea]
MAWAASSIALKALNHTYSTVLLSRAKMMKDYTSTMSLNLYVKLQIQISIEALTMTVLDPRCVPFIAISVVISSVRSQDFVTRARSNFWQDELLWAAAWLYKAIKSSTYLSYVQNNIHNSESPYAGGRFAEFGWDTKHAGIYVLVSKAILTLSYESVYYCVLQLVFAKVIEPSSFVVNADKFICSVLPESPSRHPKLLSKTGGSNMQHSTTLSFLLLVYARYLTRSNRVIQCGNVVANHPQLVQIAKRQVMDYILGDNQLDMSYMVGYGKKFPQKIHHRGSSLPSIDKHPQRIKCHEGSSYFCSTTPSPNVLVGAVVGGPDMQDKNEDSRAHFPHSEPTTYINAPPVGLLAYFKQHAS